LELVGEAMDDAQVLEAMEKNKRWPIFILEWIRNEIMKRKVVIHSDKTFQGKLNICATGTPLKFAMVQMIWSAMIVPFLTS
jgi:hypothetical protein